MRFSLFHRHGRAAACAMIVCGPLAASGAFAGDAKTSADNPPAAADHVDVVSLADSVEPLRKRFNTNKDKHRFVALLSST